MVKSYTEMMKFDNFMDRFRYLKLSGKVGDETFGFDRYLNQIFYRSKEWKKIRDFVIVRDAGCDLAIDDREILGKIEVHHMNPITEQDIMDRSDYLLDPEFLISTSSLTHKALHYGDESILPGDIILRLPNDTCPWKKGDEHGR